MALLDRVERVCRRVLDDRALRRAVLDELRGEVPFAAAVWVLTDPVTSVGSSPLAELPGPADLPDLILARYLTPLHRWTGLAQGTSATLARASSEDRSGAGRWPAVLRDHGVVDVWSTVSRDQHGCWGFLDLWRCDGPFSAAEVDVLDRVNHVVTPALRRSLAPTFALDPSSAAADDGPSVLLLSADLRVLAQTGATDGHLRALLPTEADREPVPAAAYNVAAQLLARESGVDRHPATARVHLGGGRWVTLRAARVGGPPPNPAVGLPIVVSIEPTPPAERTDLYARVLGLSERESELLRHLVGGSDTRQLAARLLVSEHTVQDHLKAIFAKADVHTRRMLVARASGLGAS